MEAGYLQRVLTFNFDSILSRACNMLGLHPSIYDFATANPHLYHLINDPSIVHLHGQGTGFVQLNTEDETGVAHTQKLGNFIAATLNSYPSLFIGYSGNADAFFPLLEEKYSEQHRLIWTGTKKTIEELESKSVKTFLKQNNSITHYIGGTYADDFLIQLAKELDCFPPELFLNPYTFLNKQIDLIQDYPLSDGLDVLNNLREYLKEQSKVPLIESLYTAFIHKYPNKESIKDLSNNEVHQIMWAYTKQAQLLFNDNNHNDSLELYAQAININDEHSGCIVNYALCLSNVAQTTKNFQLFEKSLNLFEKACEIEFKNDMVIGLYAMTLHRKASLENDDILFIKSFEKFEEAQNINQNNLDNLGNYGNALSEYGALKNDQTYFELAIKQHTKALEIQPDHVKHQNSYAINLLHLYHFDFNQDLLDKAFEMIKNVLIARPNETYNLACYYALTKQVELSKQSLEHGELHSTLPNYNHLNTDKDLDSIRNEPWFIELLERLKAKEETD